MCVCVCDVLDFLQSFDILRFARYTTMSPVQSMFTGIQVNLAFGWSHLEIDRQAIGV